jgi:hypothetical protein
MRRLLHLLVNVTMRELLALAVAVANLIVLVVLAIVIPSGSETSFEGATNLRGVTMALRSRERVPS